MRIPGLDNAHLTYCLNVHPGATFEEAQTAIFEKAQWAFRRFAAQTGLGGPFGLGIWLSAEAASTVVAEQRLERFARGLDSDGFYAFTLNGFPYGRFHGERVKEAVYRPDWADDRRYDYTTLLAYILARLLPEGVTGSISTLPITFGAWADEERVRRSVHNLAALAVFLNDLRRTSGTEIVLAIEPEPGCYLERAVDVVRFFQETLLPRGTAVIERQHGLSRKLGEEMLRRHIGVCLDTVHTGVMREEPAEAVRLLAEHGIRLAKVQLGGALRLDVGPDGPPAALDAFHDDVYLHQVTVCGERDTAFYLDLPDAPTGGPDAVGEWRVHFHVPLSWPGEGAIGTTGGQVDAAFLRAALDAGCEHFELEVYTLDVFPGEMESIEAVMAQDLVWLWERLRAVAS